MSLIKQIDRKSVHNIQSGQVINEGLTSAVKELVENALDAHATSIEVRFRNYGLDSIEVVDNGDGVAPENYESLALKHYTSKLTTYDDLGNVTTFGFRGEALSSLSALSDLSIVTARAEDVPKGTKLEFAPSGHVKSQSMVAASKGTTVTVGNLYKNLPVRRKELERNVKREFAKVLGILQAYAGVCVGVKMTVWNMPSKGKKIIAFATKGNPTTRENIANVFGAKTLQALVALDLEFEMESTVKKGIAVVEEGSREVKIVGHISRPVVGEGRNAPDRQMFFINGRPCLLPQIAKAFNEVYKGYNITQSPFIFADIQLDTNAYDVNVSPDKRTILLHDQANLLEKLKESLTNLFEKHEQTVPVNQIDQSQRLPSYKQLSLNRMMSSSVPPSSPAPATVSSPARRSEAETVHDYALDESEPPATDDARPSSPPPSSDIADALAPKRKIGSGFERTTSAKSNKKRWVYHKELDTTHPDYVPSAASNWAPPFKPNPKLVPKLHEGPKFSTTTTGDELDEASNNGEDETEEPPIPSSIPPASQTTPRKGPLAFRSPRKPDEPAMIAIGDRSPTEVRADASPPVKRRRVGGFVGSSTAPKPGFIKSLNQFLAPGTKGGRVMEDDTEGEEAEDEDDEALDVEAQEADATSDIEMREDVNDLGEDDPEPTASQAEREAHNEETEQPHDTTDGVEPLEDPDEERPEEDAEQDAADTTDPNDEYIPESEIRLRAKQRAERLLREAEAEAADPTPDILERAARLLRGSEKNSIKHLTGTHRTSITALRKSSRRLRHTPHTPPSPPNRKLETHLEEQDAAAEHRLTLTITKADFLAMSIKGQFNKGFILATRGDELFIIDQHASDEKHNFETLQLTTVVQSQPLVVPRALDLTAMDELAVLDNVDLLRRNGFLVGVNPEAVPGRRCTLRALPMSKDTVFGVRDLEELVHLIHEQPGNAAVRCAKVRAMFAMRACRMSVMVGKALTKRQMERIVRNMARLEKPWNCPHGRPTMRHLAGLGGVRVWREEEAGGCRWDGEWWRAVVEGAVEVGGGEEEGGGDEVDVPGDAGEEVL